MQIKQSEKLTDNFPLTVPTVVIKPFIKQLKAGKIKGVSFDKKGKRKDGKTEIWIKTKEPVAVQDMQLSMSVAAMIHKLVDLYRAKKRAENAEKLPPKVITVPNQIVPKLKQMKKELGIMQFKAKLQERKTEVLFKMDMCHSRNDIIIRISQINDAITTFIQGYDKKNDIEWMQKVIKNLDDQIPHVEQTAVNFVRMTGKEIIEQGYAQKYRVWKYGNAVFRFFEWFFGKRNVEYHYMDRVVDPDQEYVVKLKKPLPLAQKRTIDHAEQVALHYDYGQQIYNGYGAEMVEQYQNELAEQFNKAVMTPSSRSDNDNSPNLKIEK